MEIFEFFLVLGLLLSLLLITGLVLYQIRLYCIKQYKNTTTIFIQSKKLTLNVGKTLIDIIGGITPLICFITLIIGIIKCYSNNFYDSSYPVWILGSIIGFVVITFINYLLYLLIDIRDSLKQIAENTTKKD